MSLEQERRNLSRKQNELADLEKSLQPNKQKMPPRHAKRTPQDWRHLEQKAIRFARASFMLTNQHLKMQQERRRKSHCYKPR